MFTNGLSPAEAERLAILLEEMGEAQQIIGKILRHGYDSFHPDRERSDTNRHMLMRELGDVESAVRRLVHAGDISGDSVRAAGYDKDQRIKPYLHHQTT